MAPGKTAMCTEISSSSSEGTADPASPYGDYMSAIGTVEIVDLEPGRVVTTHRDRDDPQSAISPETRIVDYTELSPDVIVVKMHAAPIKPQKTARNSRNDVPSGLKNAVYTCTHAPEVSRSAVRTRAVGRWQRARARRGNAARSHGRPCGQYSLGYPALPSPSLEAA